MLRFSFVFFAILNVIWVIDAGPQYWNGLNVDTDSLDNPDLSTVTQSIDDGDLVP